MWYGLISPLEWQITSAVAGMWPIVGRNASERKRRLLAVAFCRRIAHLMTEERCQRLLDEAERQGLFDGDKPLGSASSLLDAIELASRYDEGPNQDDDHELREVTDRLRDVGHNYYACYVDGRGPFNYDLIATTEAAGALHSVAGDYQSVRVAARQASYAIAIFNNGTDTEPGDPAEESVQCDLIRDVVQHPDLAATIAPAWKTETVVSLARGIYDQRAFDRMPILADALEEAGCDDSTILHHCRADSLHVRGCWVVDQVLGYE